MAHKSSSARLSFKGFLIDTILLQILPRQKESESSRSTLQGRRGAIGLSTQGRRERQLGT
eukprot:378093-Amorphochlora_amoeboformis.AAC.1